jgi:hypothetical protein
MTVEVEVTFPTPKTAKIKIDGKVVVKRCKVQDVEIHLNRLGVN